MQGICNHIINYNLTFTSLSLIIHIDICGLSTSKFVSDYTFQSHLRLFKRNYLKIRKKPEGYIFILFHLYSHISHSKINK